MPAKPLFLTIAGLVAGLALATPTAAVPAPPADVSGVWSWSRVEQLTFPAWVAQGLLGIQPEGPTSIARCEASGTMTLTQTDAAFSGTFQQTAQVCVTRGGQAFQDPFAFVPVGIEDGEVHGQSSRMRLDGLAIDCLYHAVITDVQSGVATGLTGGGRCIVPGHPKSDLPLDPPPGGTSTTLSFEASRP